MARNTAEPTRPDDAETGDSVALDALLRAISLESGQMAEQCNILQWTISALLETVNHPDLGAEIHMLQDIDRIQQTLEDVAALLAAASGLSAPSPVAKHMLAPAVRLESLRQRLGLSDGPSLETRTSEPDDVTFF